MIICVLCHVCDVEIKYYYPSTVKRRKTAVHNRHRTVVSLDVLSTAVTARSTPVWYRIRYGGEPYFAAAAARGRYN